MPNKPIPTSSDPDDSCRFDQAFRWVCWVGFAILLAIYLVSVANRYLINDDYQGLYTAWLKSQGKVAGRDYYLTSYYLLTDLMAPLFRVWRETWFPVYVMRVFFIAVIATTMVLMHRVCLRLFDGATGWVLPLLLLSTTAMLHRGLDLRPDLITNLFWVGIILVLLGRDLLSWRSSAAVGAMLTFVTLNRFKGLMIVPLVLVVYAWEISRPGRSTMRDSARILVGGILGVFLVALPYLAWVSATDGFGEFMQVHRALFMDLGHSFSDGPGILADTAKHSIRLDYLFWAFSTAGMWLRVRSWRAYSPRENILVAGLVATSAATVAFNPAYYAYNLMTLQTLLAPFAANGFLGAIRILQARIAPAFAAAFLLLPIAWNWKAIAEVTQESNRHQKELQTFFLQYLNPSQAVFALEGVGLYRPSVFHWRFPAVLSARYLGGAWTYSQELAAAKPEVLVLSYRLPGWLTYSDVQFISAHYVFLSPLILVPGFDSAGKGQVATFDALVPGRYEVLMTATGACSLDGSVIHPGDILDLPAGPHLVELDNARCILRHHFPESAKALLANPEGLPYLSPPGQTLPEPIVGSRP